MTDIIVGDIILTGDIHEAIAFPFSIETKAYNELNFKDPLLENNSKLYSFWEQSSADAKRAKKQPIVLSRQNGMPKGSYFVQLSIPLHKHLGLDKYYFLQFDEDFIVMMSNDFFKIDYRVAQKKIRYYEEN